MLQLKIYNHHVSINWFVNLIIGSTLSRCFVHLSLCIAEILKTGISQVNFHHINIFMDTILITYMYKHIEKN